MACDVTVEKPISRGLINTEAFWRQAFSKKLRKTTREVVSTSKVLWYLLNHVGTKRTGKKFAPVRQKLREDLWDRHHQEVVGSYNDQPQRRWMVTVRHPHLAYETGWQKLRCCSTTQCLADGRSRMKRKENYKVVRTSPHAFTRLQSLQLVTLMCIEPTNSLNIVVFDRLFDCY